LKIVSTSYSKSGEFSDPHLWLDRISFYTGILEQLAIKYDVTSIERISYQGELRKNGVNYRFIHLKSKVVRFPWEMHQYIKRLQPDVVLVNGLIFPLQLIQLRKTLGKKVKILVLHRGERPFTGVKGWLQKMADRSVDGYFFSSSEFGNGWKENINTSKIHEIVQASSAFISKDRQLARKQLQIRGERIFLWVGRLDANKDPVTVVKTFLRYLEDFPNARFYMIHQSTELLNEVEKVIRGDDRILLVGKKAHKDLQDWYSAADFIISGSHREGSGISVIEAMSCGCIPIVTSIPSFVSMTGNGKCGILFEAGNEGDLLRSLRSTATMNLEEERIKVRHRFKEELSFQAIAGKFDKVVHSLQEKSHG
jgi:glycosyltransferase involved in cell wall biosynthesis